MAELLAEVFSYEIGCGLINMDCIRNKTTKEVLEAASRSIVIPLDIR